MAELHLTLTKPEVNILRNALQWILRYNPNVALSKEACTNLYDKLEAVLIEHNKRAFTGPSDDGTRENDLRILLTQLELDAVRCAITRKKPSPKQRPAYAEALKTALAKIEQAHGTALGDFLVAHE